MTEDRPASPFRAVPQEHVLRDDRHFGSDDGGLGFFAEAVAAPHPEVDAVFSAGVAAMGGLHGDAPVEFRGELAADPAARAAFILKGPAGVRRVA